MHLTIKVSVQESQSDIEDEVGAQEAASSMPALEKKKARGNDEEPETVEGTTGADVQGSNVMLFA